MAEVNGVNEALIGIARLVSLVSVVTMKQAKQRWTQLLREHWTWSVLQGLVVSRPEYNFLCPASQSPTSMKLCLSQNSPRHKIKCTCLHRPYRESNLTSSGEKKQQKNVRTLKSQTLMDKRWLGENKCRCAVETRRRWKRSPGLSLIRKCSICTKFQNQIQHNRDFSDAWIKGTSNLCLSSLISSTATLAPYLHITFACPISHY
jgi:hypothetical protein